MIRLIFFAGFLLFAHDTFAAKSYDCSIESKVNGEDDFCYPHMDLQFEIADTLSFFNCKWVSGLSCKVKYSGRRPLPSEVFFEEYDKKGNKLGKRTRLIYPKLSQGEIGHATFFLRSSSPARIKIIGVWDGPYKDPY